MSVGRVDVDEEEFGVFQGDHAAFLIVLVDSDPEANVEGLGFGEDAGSGVAGFFGGIPVGFVAAEIEWKFDLLWAGLGFLKAEEIRLMLENEVGKVFLQDGAQAIDVPGYEFHGDMLKEKQPRPRGNRGCLKKSFAGQINASRTGSACEHLADQASYALLHVGHGEGDRLP